MTPTEATALTARLRDREARSEFDDWGILSEAADAIDALAAENARLAEAVCQEASRLRDNSTRLEWIAPCRARLERAGDYEVDNG